MGNNNEVNGLKSAIDQKVYYYDLPRIENSNKPIFKIERVAENRPYYTNFLNAKRLMK